MNRIRRKFLTQSNGILLLSFMFAAFLMHIIFLLGGFYPFGDKTVLVMDMKGQYVEFFSSLRYIGESDNSLFFSWSRSMGGNFMGLLAYYIASPLSFITLFFPIEELPTAMYVLTVLKVGLCGLSFSVFLEYGLNKRSGKWIVIPFSVCYALMSYNLVYGMCLMWLDGVIFLPLILLGIEKIMDGKKGFVYMLSIAALFICNYYTAYMVGIFSALYLMVRVISEYQKEKKKELAGVLIRFTINTFFAFGLAMPLLLPTVKDLMAGKFAQQNYFPTDIVYNFSFLDVFKKLLPGQYDSITNAGALPSIFCGCLTVFFSFLFFLHKKYKVREKLGFALIGIILLCSFWIFDLDLVWHGFQYPNWFPYRYAFLFSTLLVYLAYRGYMMFESKLVEQMNVLVPLIFLLFVSVEMIVNGQAVLKGIDEQFHYGTINEYSAFIEKTDPAVQEMQTKDQGFYRMEKDYEYSKNDAMLLGYNGMTHYSSTFNARINQLTAKLGFAQTHIWNSGYGSTLLTDSLFNVKYRLQESALPSDYQCVSAYEEVTLYENTRALSIGYMVDEAVLGKKVEWGSNPFENQNRMLNDFMGEEVSCFTGVPFDKKEHTGGFSLSFIAETENPYYLHMEGSGWADIYVNGEFVGNYFSSETKCNLYIGEFNIGEQIEIEVSTTTQAYNERVYQLDVDTFEKVIAKLKNGQLDVKKHKNGKIKGTITAGTNQVLFTSIPFDKGFTVKVDGKSVDLYTYADTFLMLPLSEGEHEIEISYISPGFVEGVLIAVATILVCVLYYRWNDYKKRIVFTKKN